MTAPTCGRPSCPGTHGPVYQPGRDCRACYVRRFRDRLPPPPGPVGVPLGRAPVERPPCIHEGEIVARCTSCGPKEGRHRRRCEMHGVCTRVAQMDMPHEGCDECEHYAPARPAPLGVRFVDQTLLKPRPAGWGFNGSMIRHRGRLLLAYRVGQAGSQTWLAELDERLRPVGNRRLNLDHPAATHGREDPRLFEFRGRLHLMYHGVAGASGPVNVLYARLGDDFQPERVYHPQLPERGPVEKSHSYFEGLDGELYAVYSVGPIHRVLQIDGERVVGRWDQPYRLPWNGGHMRGGAPPVLLPGGERFGHWFHGRIDVNAAGQRTRGALYTAGYYEFESRPPFRPVRGTPSFLACGNPAELRHWQRETEFPAVVWPAGAILEGGSWRVSCGWQEEEVHVAEWAAAALDASLVEVETDRRVLPCSS